MAEFRSGKLAVIWMASEGDKEHAGVVRKELEGYGIETDLRVASAHKSAALALEIVNGYAVDGRQIVYCTVPRRSDGLSGFVSGHSPYPVVACPPAPRPGEYDGAYLSSSLDAPSRSSPMVVKDPKNAARAIASIFALSDPELMEELEKGIERVRESLGEADKSFHPQG